MTIFPTPVLVTASFAWVYNFRKFYAYLGGLTKSPLSRRTAHLLNMVVDQLLSLWAIQVDSETVLRKSKHDDFPG